MFIGKNTLLVNVNNINISPATNIETVYMEQVDDTVVDGSMEVYQVHLRAIHKRMPILYLISDASIAVGETEYEPLDIRYGISYDKLRDPANNYGKTTLNDFEDTDNSSIIASVDGSILVFYNKETSEIYYSGKTYKKEDLSKHYDLGQILKHIEAKGQYNYIADGLYNDMDIFNTQLVNKTETTKSEYWDPSINYLENFTIIIDSSLAKLEADVSLYCNSMHAHLVSLTEFFKMIKNGNLVQSDLYLIKYTTSYWLLIRAISNTSISVKAYMCKNVKYTGTSTSAPTYNECSFDIFGEVLLSLADTLSVRSDILISYMYDYANNIKASFDFISYNNISGTDITVKSTNKDTIEIRNGHNIIIGPECSSILILNTSHAKVEYNCNDVIVSSVDMALIGANSSDIQLSNSKCITLNGNNVSVFCDNANNTRVDYVCNYINVTGNNNNILANSNNISINGNNNVIGINNENIVLDNAENIVTLQNNKNITCSSTYSIELMQGGHDDTFDERDNHILFVNSSIKKIDGTAPTYASTMYDEVINASVYNLNVEESPAIAKEKTFTIHDRELPAYILHYLADTSTTELQQYNYIELTHDATTQLELNSSIYYWADGLKCLTYQINDSKFPLAEIVTLSTLDANSINLAWNMIYGNNPGLKAGTYIRYVDNMDEHVGKKMQLDLEYDKEQRLHHYVNYQISPYDVSYRAYVRYKSAEKGIDIALPYTKDISGTPPVETGRLIYSCNVNYVVDQDTSIVYSMRSVTDGEIDIKFAGYDTNEKDIKKYYIDLPQGKGGYWTCGEDASLSVDIDPDNTVMELITDVLSENDEYHMHISYNFEHDRLGHVLGGGWDADIALCDEDKTILDMALTKLKMFNLDSSSAYAVLIYQRYTDQSGTIVSGTYDEYSYTGEPYIVNNNYVITLKFNASTNMYDFYGNRNMYLYSKGTSSIYLDTVFANSSSYTKYEPVFYTYENVPNASVNSSTKSASGWYYVWNRDNNKSSLLQSFDLKVRKP